MSRRFGVAAVLLLASIMPVGAADLPPRKAGLWETRTILERHDGTGTMTVQTCIDASTEQITRGGGGLLAQGGCSNREVQRSGDTVTIDATCPFKDTTASYHAVITGSFDSAYTANVTHQSDAMPGGKMTVTVTARWLGPCAADQKPGDVIMSNGRKQNILDEIQKRGSPQGGPPQH